MSLFFNESLGVRRRGECPAKIENFPPVNEPVIEEAMLCYLVSRSI
jgi:hypothetical protein